MPVLKTKVGGEWVPLVAGRDGAQGPPGPASPHEGSNIAVGVRQYGAVGDGTTIDTTAVTAALTAAGASGFVDFEAGTYRVTGNLGRKFWEARRSGPGVITDASGNTFRITPRSLADVNTIYVHGTTGDDANDGISPTRPLRTLNAVRDIFETGNGFDQGTWVVRLSGVITGGVRFQDLPFTKAFLRFEGDPLTDGRPSTWIVNDPADGERFGLRFEEGQNQRVHLARLGFRGFNTGGGAGWIMKSGGFIRVEDCATEDCQIPSIYTGSVGFSEIRSTHQGYQSSGSRNQYSSSGSWTECKFLGGPNAVEGTHTSRNSVSHIDKCILQDHIRTGSWTDMSSRISSAGSAYKRNGWYGIRGESHATVHVDDSTYGPNVFGTGADANGFKDVSLTGTSVLAGTEGIYAIPEHLADAQSGTWTTSVQMRNGRQLQSYRIGRGARMRIRAWGTGGGASASVEVRFGSTSVRTIATTTSSWLIELTAQHDDGTAWQILSTLNGAGPTIQSVPSVREDLRPTLVATGVMIRGVEFYTGG